MKTSSPGKILLGFVLVFGFCLNGNAQLLKKLGKRAERAAERTIERRVDKETSEKTDQVLDSILEPGSGGNKQGPNTTPSPTGNEPNTQSGQSGGPTGSSGPKTIEVYSKFDYVPGDKQLFFDDFGNDFIGDFPSKWNTNAGGEVVTLGDSPQKWFGFKSGYNIYYIPNVPQLPEEYTIEFDLAAVGLDRQTSSTAQLQIMLSNDEKFDMGSNFAFAEIPFCQYAAIGVTVANR
ncbi:MAG: OmpA family protein, partial [Allomuricauda sp.]